MWEDPRGPVSEAAAAHWTDRLSQCEQKWSQCLYMDLAEEMPWKKIRETKFLEGQCTSNRRSLGSEVFKVKHRGPPSK